MKKATSKKDPYKILIVHNHYQQRGGEDSVVEAERELLVSKGHEVILFERHNDEINQSSKVQIAVQTVWASKVEKALAAVLLDAAPDVVHVHNTFPLISPAIYWVAYKLGIPVIQTLHNFRLLCPQAMFLRDGKVCEDCMGKIPWRGVTRGCYRNSHAQSAVLAGMVTLHRFVGTWNNKVTRYIALNDFCRRKFIAGGLPADRISIKPNFVNFPAPTVEHRSGLLFVGRLSKEKGIDVLIAAVNSVAGVNLRVAGVGPEAHLLAGKVGISQLGNLSGEEIHSEMMAASALVLPSIWYENFPRTLVEAFASGLPVIASNIGALAELVEDGVTGLLFEPGDPVDLAKKLRWAANHPEKMLWMGQNARKKYEMNFTAETNYAQLMSIYAQAINESAIERGPAA